MMNFTEHQHPVSASIIKPDDKTIERLMNPLLKRRSRILQIALDLLEELPQRLGESAIDIEWRLQPLIATALLASETDMEPVKALIQGFRREPALANLFNERMSGHFRGDVQHAPPPTEFVQVEMLYGTDRAPSPTEGEHFSGKRNDTGGLSLGSSLVTIPRRHQPGVLESPGLFDRWFGNAQDTSRYVLLAQVESLDTAAFGDAVRSQLRACPAETPRALVFIHGYNVSFTDALRRGAQIAHDLQFPGARLCFSWPSRGHHTAYSADKESADWAEKHLADFLCQLRAAAPGLALHLIAHSMGNVVLTRALERLHLQREHQPDNTPHVALAAPDIDVGVFRARADSLCASAQRVTLYASSRDLALRLSRLFNGGIPRAGDAGSGLVMVNGMDTIDATQVDSSLLSLGHSYFSNQGSVLRDLAALFNDNKPPAQRGLLLHRHPPHWLLQP